AAQTIGGRKYARRIDRREGHPFPLSPRPPQRNPHLDPSPSAEVCPKPLNRLRSSKLAVTPALTPDRVCDVEGDADAEPRTSESGCRPDANPPALLRSRLCLTYSYARVLSVGRCFHESLTSPSRTRPTPHLSDVLSAPRAAPTANSAGRVEQTLAS